MNSSTHYNSLLNVYSRLGDDISRMIYRKRVDFAIAGYGGSEFSVISYNLDILDEIRTKYANIISQLKMRQRCGTRIAIYPATRSYGATMYEIMKKLDVPPNFYCDRDPAKHGRLHYDGNPIISLDNLLEYGNETAFVIMFPGYEDEFENYLKDKGVASSDIYTCFSRWIMENDRNKGYFSTGLFEPTDNEIFVNCGAYDGEDIRRFVEWSGNKYRKAYAFEPDENNIRLIQKNIEQFENIEIVPRGVYRDERTLTFNSGNAMSSSFNGNGTESIDVVSIDNVIGNDKVTLISMDIEGAELDALIGATNTIRKNKPRLAIRLYHKLEDIFEIPEYILSLVPDYKLYLRQYCIVGDTTLYCIADESSVLATNT